MAACPTIRRPSTARCASRTTTGTTPKRPPASAAPGLAAVPAAALEAALPHLAAQERPARGDEPLTHFFHCWRFPDHHACAVALIERQQVENDQLLRRQPEPQPAPELAVPLAGGVAVAALECIRQAYEPGTIAHDTAHKAVDDCHAALRANAATTAAAREPERAPGHMMVMRGTIAVRDAEIGQLRARVADAIEERDDYAARVNAANRSCAKVAAERNDLRDLLDEVGTLAANAPEDGDSFGLLEEIAMRIGAADVPEGAG